MSKLPRIKGAVIDRRTLDILEMVEKEISTFRGIRHLWADAVAEERADGEDLMADQERVLWSAIGQAMALSAHAFPGKSPHAAFAPLVTMLASEPPSDGRHVLALIVQQYEEDGEVYYARVWVVAYYGRSEPEGWRLASGERIHPSLWCKIAKPSIPSEYVIPSKGV